MAKITEEGPVTIPYRKGLAKVLMSHASSDPPTGRVVGRYVLVWLKEGKNWATAYQGRKRGGAWREGWVCGLYFGTDFDAALKDYQERTNTKP